MKVAILFGSKSDAPLMKKAVDVLREFGVSFSSRAISAHRCPELLSETIHAFEEDGVEVIIAGAGLAAHLPGVVASQTLIPVIGVPLDTGSLNGLDALLSIVQMPKQVPVATVGIGNSSNAAYLACEILAIKYPEMKKKLALFRKQNKEELALHAGELEL